MMSGKALEFIPGMKAKQWHVIIPLSLPPSIGIGEAKQRLPTYETTTASAKPVDEVTPVIYGNVGGTLVRCLRQTEELR